VLTILICIDSYHFGKLEPDPDPHRSGKLDPDQSKKQGLDPDPHHCEKVDASEDHFGELEGPNREKRTGRWGGIFANHRCVQVSQVGGPDNNFLICLLFKSMSFLCYLLNPFEQGNFTYWTITVHRMMTSEVN
jgi:hypothetical protein